MGTRQDPLLSVVVTIVDGREATARILDVLTSQRDPPPLEILVPYDDSVADAVSLAPEYPAVTFQSIGPVATEAPIASAAGQHELFDRRRAAALGVARGEIVAILEDRGLPAADWARTAVRLHQAPWAVIGGAIEPAPSRLIDWALHVCDFSRYALPFAAGPVSWVSDVNVTYKRHALEQTRHLWQHRFHEPLVHWSLLREGEVLYLSPELVVNHCRAPRPLGELLRQRFDWGRLYGAIRAGTTGPPSRILRAIATPLVPAVLLVRHARVRIRRREGWRFLRAIPVLVLLLGGWAVGEAWGLATGRASAR